MESKNLIVIIYINLEQDNQVAKLFEYFGNNIMFLETICLNILN